MTSEHPPPPPDLEVQLAPDVLVRDGGRLLCGGTPFRMVRLRAAGARVAARWRIGGPVGDTLAARALARRLIDAGMLLSAPGTPADTSSLEIVVPARDRLPDLRRCLAALVEHCPEAQIVVVDDGSEHPGAVAAIAEEHRAAIVRHVIPRGPAAARNAGLAATAGPLIAFVDSDVVVDRGCLARLVAHFGDPAVGAVAPRVLALEPDGSALGRYEATRSSLDMGSRPASAAPGSAVPYVPSTTLVVRREAVPTGFDERLHVGEDVDFVWRIIGSGRRVAYDPAATVRHAHRLRPAPFWRRRWDYARSIGPLARRHPHALPALRTEPWSAAIIGLLLLRRPVAAAIVAAARVEILRHRIAKHSDHPTTLATELLAHSLTGAARGASHAVRRTWSPLLLLAVTRSGTARWTLAAATAFHVIDDQRPARHLALSLADDLVAALGSWAGCLAARTGRPLLPRLR